MLKELAELTGKPTQDSQAQQLGISDTSLSSYLAGSRIPRESTLVKMLARARVPEHQHGIYLKARQNAENAPRTQAYSQNGHIPPTLPPTDTDNADEPLPGRPQTKIRPGKQHPWLLGGLICLALILLGVIMQQLSSGSPGTATTPPRAVLLKCSLVNTMSSPVYVKIGDRKPVKSKVLGDRVRLVEVPHETGPDGILYQAVALPDPHDSPNGVGWMPAADLIPDPRQCANLGKRP
jgi:transcriptional regulator with XRE-family HTH domain